MTKEEKHFYISLGRHSNIPECCINFYMNEWIPLIDFLTNPGIPFDTRKQRAEEFKEHQRKSIKFDYIPCHSCVASKPGGRMHWCNLQNPSCQPFENIDTFLATYPLV